MGEGVNENYQICGMTISIFSQISEKQAEKATL